MRIIYANSPDDALFQGLDRLKHTGVREESRNGPVLAIPGPVTTVYTNPRRRVSLDSRRDANPFFHLAEAIWMLAGRSDVATVAKFVKRMESFSDNGITLHGAYGYRWRAHFGYDQLGWVIKTLKADAKTRRAVVQMWDATADPSMADRGGKDVPCNTQIYFRVLNGALDMTVTCRSNDAVWGAHGANVVHFSMLQEAVALACGYLVGAYWQVSNNYHIYTARPDVMRLMAKDDEPRWPSPGEVLPPLAPPLFENGGELDSFVEEAMSFVIGDGCFAATLPFVYKVVAPMMTAHELHKNGKTADAIALLSATAYCDWNVAGKKWLERRLAGAPAVKETR